MTTTSRSAGSDSTYRPRLRLDLEFGARIEGKIVEVDDRLFHRQITLQEVGALLIDASDGIKTADELIEAVTDPTDGRPRHVVERGLRGLMLMNLFEGAGEAFVERARKLDKGEVELEMVALPEARFACQASGDCCKHYILGPLTNEDVARLESLPIAERLPDLPPGPYVVPRSDDDDDDAMMLRLVHEECVFRSKEGQCRLHGEFGARSKPGLCQLYPIGAVRTLQRIQIFDDGECSTFGVSARSGLPLSQDFERIGELITQRPLFEHPAVYLNDDIPLDYGHIQRLLDAQIEFVGQNHGTAGQTAAALTNILREFVHRVSECPLRAGEPDATIDDFLAQDWLPFYEDAPDENRRDGYIRISDLVDEIMETATRMAHESELSGRLYAHFADLAHFVGMLARYRHDPGAIELPDFFANTLAIPVDPEIDDVLRLSFRHFLYGRRITPLARITGGALTLLFTYLFSAGGARLLAGLERADKVQMHHFNRAHMLTRRVLRRKPAVQLAKQSELVWPVAAATPSMFDKL